MTNRIKEDFPNNISVYQDEYYKFTQDALCLAKFCNVKPTDHLLEFCAGTGAISFYTYSLNKVEKVYLNEIQERLTKTIEENIATNNLNNVFKCLNCDLNKLKSEDFSKKLDVIVCNPPYYRISKAVNQQYEIAISKHELCVTLEQIIAKAKELIKDRGRLYIVMTEERSAELLGLLFKYNFHAKKIKYFTNALKRVKLMLVEAVFNGRVGTKIEIEQGE